MVLDVVVNSAHIAIEYVLLVLDKYRDLVLLRFPHAQVYLLGANALAGSLRVSEMNAGKPRMYWLHSFLLVLVTSFGGGWVAPWLIGKPSIPVANDVVIPLTLVIWYLIHCVVGVESLLNLLPVKVAWTVFVGLFRTHAVLNMVNVAVTSLKAGPYYPIPLVGPIVAGTALGTLGQFLPFSKGFGAIETGTPWPLQGAFLSAVFYHLMVNDTEGAAGTALRAVCGTYSEPTVRVLVASMHIATLLLQLFFSPDANLFTPVHKLLYMVFQTEGPTNVMQKPLVQTVGWDIHTRVALERAIEVGRVLVVLLVLSLHVYHSAPPTVLRAAGTGPVGITQQISLGKSVGVCQLFSYARSCEPVYLTLENTASDASKGGVSLQLSSYKGTAAKNWFGCSSSSSSDSKGAGKQKVTWQRPISRRPVLVGEGAVVVSARLDGSTGVLRVVATSDANGQEEALWTSSSRCPTGKTAAAAAATTGSAYLTLDLATGTPVVHCPDGNTVVALN